MVDWLLVWGTLLVALVALVQPWAIALWRYLFRQAQIDIYETGLIEIGFSSFGPTIGLHGSIFAQHQNVFVKSAEIRLTRDRDQAKHVFQWGLFRSPILFPSPGAMRLCAGMSLPKDSAQQYNILFWDRDTQEHMRPLIDVVREAWMGELVPIGSPAALDPTTVQAIYQNFSQAPLHVDTYTVLGRLCYWEAGDYVLELCIQSVQPKAPFTKKWKFCLTAREADYVRINVLRILQDTCGQPVTPWHFAYLKYMPT